MASEDKEKSFEECLTALEQVVNQIETGEMSLEESLSNFEKGVRLVKTCSERLSEVEKRIELLTKDPGGKLQLDLLADLDENAKADG